MAVGDVYEVAIHYQNTGTKQQYWTILHLLQIVEAFANPDEYLISAAVADWVTVNIKPCINVAVTYVDVLTQRIFPLPRTAGRYSSAGTGAGAIAGDALPGQCAMLIQKRTIYAGRKYRGRVYQPGLSESDQANGTWAGANIATLAGNWDTFLTGTLIDDNANQYVWVVCDKTGGVRVNAISNTRLDLVVRTQRRRAQFAGI